MKRAELIRQIEAEVHTVKPFDIQEQAHITDTLGWVRNSANIFRIAKPDKPPKHLVSYFVLIDPEQRSILLGDHIKAQLWLPPGGHVELNEHPRNTVLRETREELGLEAVFLHGHDKPFFVTVNQTGGLTAGHTDVSLWYLLRGDIHQPLNFDRREFSDMTWFSFDEVLQSHPAIFDRHMQRFIRKLNFYMV